MFFRPRRHYGGGHNDVFMLMMFMGLVQRIQNLPYKPPVTLALMAVMAALHFLPREFGVLASLDHSAFWPEAIVHAGEWHRLWISALLHAGHTHLYYNLTSFLYKGVVLEAAMGSEPFAGLVVAALILSQGLFLAASLYVAPALGFHDAPYVRTVGWSGVIFALKVLVNGNGVAEGNQLGLAQVLGLNLPWDQVVWVELVLAHFLSPGSSFLGHLCGIVAGLVIKHVLLPALARRPTVARFHGRGETGQAPPPVHVRAAPPPAALGATAQHHRPAPPPPLSPDRPFVPAELSAEELRLRRMARFGS